MTSCNRRKFLKTAAAVPVAAAGALVAGKVVTRPTPTTPFISGCMTGAPLTFTKEFVENFPFDHHHDAARYVTADLQRDLVRRVSNGFEQKFLDLLRARP